MTSININEAKTHLSRYAKRIKAGETIILCDRNIPFAEIRPLTPKPSRQKRVLGQLKGKVHFNKAFFEADPSIEADFLNDPLISPQIKRAAKSVKR
jgi:antitoxin (DNA-binding transcriptional repressor) of toxin-antitoxin stability system